MRCVPVWSVLFLFSLATAAGKTAQANLEAVLQTTSAVGVVIDAQSGSPIARVGDVDTRSTPGSVLKPLFLSAALERGYVLPQTSVFCRRSLEIQNAGRSWNLSCTHPRGNRAFAAQEALAYSCNQYFAVLADRTPPEQTGAILRHYGLTQISVPQTKAQKELLVLGVAGILVTPAEIAVAYRRLARDLDEDVALQPVRAGLEASVAYGMAHNAAVSGEAILGKTGTASDAGNGRSHGWFAGIAQLHHKATVIVIYLSQGNGADAARLAQHFIVASRAR